MRWDLQINNCCPQYGHFFKLRQTQIIEKPCCIKNSKQKLHCKPNRKQINMLLLSPHIASQAGPQYLRPLLLYTQYASTSASSDSSCILVVMNSAFSLRWRHHLYCFISWEYTDTHQAQIQTLLLTCDGVFVKTLLSESAVLHVGCAQGNLWDVHQRYEDLTKTSERCTIP